MLDVGQHMVNTGAGGLIGGGAGAGLGALFGKLMSKKYPDLGYAIPMLAGGALGSLGGGAVGASIKPEMTPQQEQLLLQQLHRDYPDVF